MKQKKTLINRQISPGREIQSFGATIEKVLSQVTTHLVLDGEGNQSRSSEDDWNEQVSSYGKRWYVDPYEEFERPISAPGIEPGNILEASTGRTRPK